jgi:hypothetical protein
MSPAPASSHHTGRAPFAPFSTRLALCKVAHGALLASARTVMVACELMGLTPGRRNDRKIEAKSCYRVRYALRYPQSPPALDACEVIS